MKILFYFHFTTHQMRLVSMTAILCTSPAIAQSNIALYGLIGNGLFNTSTKTNGVRGSTTGLISGGFTSPRWGVRGTETLTSDLKVKFEYQGAININEGSYLNEGRAFGLGAWVGLAGDWGELRMGRQYSSTTDYFVMDASPFANSFTQAGVGRSGFRAADVVFQDNLIKYISPQLKGFEFSTSYSFNSRGDEQPSKNDNTRAYSLSGLYQNKIFKLISTYDRVLPSREDAYANGRRPSAIQLSVVAHFQPVRLYAAWTTQRNGWIKLSEGAASGDNSLGEAGYFDGKVNAWLLGAQYTLKKHKIFGTFQYVDPDQKAFTNAKAINVINLGYTYDLSKRTQLYAMGSFFDGQMYTFRPDSYSRRFGGGIIYRF